MHSDIHLMLHELRAGELRTAAAGQVPGAQLRVQLRTRLGLAFVGLGLRLLRQPPAQARSATRLA
ncbi:hypothetical protein AB0903_34160 [Streptomyces sp. NPDC048389]|uniref:hypothetical protein n=1 Tax=Streptomyces sp. NPDC048389 TaxID=3154622 RepID=UPI003454DB0E